MARWQIEQRAECWYRIEVEADSFEDAINKANEAKSWEFEFLPDSVEFTDNYWGENTETEEQFTQYEGLIIGETNG